MQDSQADTRNRDHGTLKNHQRDLVISQLAVEATLELRNSEDRPDENSDSRSRETYSYILLAFQWQKQKE